MEKICIATFCMDAFILVKKKKKNYRLPTERFFNTFCIDIFTAICLETFLYFYPTKCLQNW